MPHLRRLSFLIVFLLAACSDRTAAPIVPAALSFGPNKTVFIGTTRAINDAGVYGIERSPSLNLLRAVVSIPPERDIGTVSDGFEKPKPQRDFVLAAMDRYETPTGFARDLSRSISRTKSGQREVTIFVHGFNNSFTDAAFRIAQLSHDLELPGTLVSYSWPSRGNPLGYEYDRDSALFARDGLADLLRAVRSAGNPDIILVAHSMGSALVMETLRQLEIADPGWTGRNLQGLVLMSPDINVDVFRSQMKRIKSVPDPFVVIVSRKDHILRLSSRLRGQKTQLGNIDNVDEVSDLPITIVDVTEFTDRKAGNHFVAGGSPALIQILRRSQDLDREFLRGRNGSALRIPGTRRVISQAQEVELIYPASDDR